MATPPAPLPPSAGSRASEPIDSTKSACCWCDDFTKEISGYDAPRYYTRFGPDGRATDYRTRIRYMLIVPFKTGITIVVRVRYRLEKDPSITDAQAATAMNRAENGVSYPWNGKRMLTVEDPMCNSRRFLIQYQIEWVDSGEHYVFKLRSTPGRAGVSGYVLEASLETRDWSFAHEYGHCVGLPDEYTCNSGHHPESVGYQKPDGTMDTPVVATWDRPATDPAATIMSSSGCATVLVRHAWNIAIEVQALLSQKLGRTIRCTIT